MHEIGGYSLDEWLAIVGILSAVGGFLVWLLRFAIKSGTQNLSNKISHLIGQFDNLNSTMRSIENSANRTAKRVDVLEDRLEEHIGEAKVRNNRIANLEHEIFDKKKR